MFKGFFKELKKVGNQEIQIPIDADDDGYLDKECPSKECIFKFKVNAEDWKNIFKDEAVFCPQCRHEAPSDAWWTTEQIEEGKRQALKKLKSDIHQALAKDARSFNSRPQKGFLKLSMKVSGHSPSFALVPIKSQQEMEQKITCESCNSRFAVIGSAFFCPSCGHNSVERMFSEAIKKVESNIANLEKVKTALKESNLHDEAENTGRFIIESSLVACVTSLQKYSEEIYKKHPGAKTIQQNGFQRIDYMISSWQDLLGESLSQWIDDHELKFMGIMYQRRHLLQHQEGIVDQKYIDKSGDHAYKVGQRVVVKERDVLQLASIVTKIYEEIRKLPLERKAETI